MSADTEEADALAVEAMVADIRTNLVCFMC